MAIRWALPTALLLALLQLSACSSSGRQEELPVDSAYQIAPGPLPITTVNRTSLAFPALDKELQMRLAFPASGGPYPVIVFSHGNGCSQDMYAGFADHWASYGFVVIQPVHMDSMDLGFSMKGVTMEIMTKVVSDRPKDVQFILDSFDQLEAQVPDLAGKLDPSRLVAAGHSMGSGTAMVLNGVAMTNPIDQFTLSSDESRFQAMILISEPSNNRIMPEEPWRMATVPTIIVTGSEDFSTTGAPDGKKSKNAWYIPADAVYPEQPHYYLFMDGSDHYFGGVICKSDRPGPLDYGALNISNGVTTAFLNAYIYKDEVAMRFIGSDHVKALSNGRATLDIR